jgi:hypothetical protein
MDECLSEPPRVAKRTDDPHERVVFNKGGNDDFGSYLLQYPDDPDPCIV